MIDICYYCREAPLVIFSGGMPYGNHNKGLTIMRGRSKSLILSDYVVDFECLYTTLPTSGIVSLQQLLTAFNSNCFQQLSTAYNSFQPLSTAYNSFQQLSTACSYYNRDTLIILMALLFSQKIIVIN